MSSTLPSSLSSSLSSSLFGARSLFSVAALASGVAWGLLPLAAQAQPQVQAQPKSPETKEPVPAALAGADSSEKEWCGVPFCREAEALRRAGDLQGALKLYRYINDEVDVDESVVKKPLLWFAIASLHGGLKQPEQGLSALRKYEEYLAKHTDAELPAGQKRADVARLEQELRMLMGRVRIFGNTPNLRVVIDGKPAGVTPLRGPVAVLPGHHRIDLIGDKTESQEVDVASGQEVLIWPVQPTVGQPQVLATPSGVDTARAPRPAWRIAIGAIGIGAGVAMIGAGAGALATDGTCVSTGMKGACPVEVGADNQPVRRVIDGKPAGGGLIAAGIVAAAVGTVLIALPGPAKKPPVHAAISFQNGASLTLGTSF